MERTIIVAVFNSKTKDHEIDQIITEMKLLTRSAGGVVIEVVYQKRDALDKKYLIGKGKTEEIKEWINSKNIEMVVFFNQLNNNQQRNLEEFLQVKTIDRTRLILDIFATRARSLQGKLQVELAQMLYLLPRLTGKGVELSRLGGGIGTRGPGETKLEADRRTIKKRISLLKHKLDRVIKNRAVQRKSRKTYPVPVISLAGYTSAGKSTVFKALAGENVPISANLFSTLDPLLRRVELSEIEQGLYFLLSDTVGFIRQMPTELFKAFKATLEEIIQSDTIIHVIDISNPNYQIQKQEVDNILKELGIPDHNIINVYNKIDLLEQAGELAGYKPDPIRSGEVYISAISNLGINELKKLIFVKHFSDYKRYRLSIPFNMLNLTSLEKWAIILTKNSNNNIMELEVLCSQEKMVKFKKKYGGLLK